MNHHKDPTISPNKATVSKKAEDPSSFVQRARDDVLVRREYSSAIASIVPVLSDRNGDLNLFNTTQKVRLWLLLADCYFITQRHLDGCDAAQSAVRLSNGLSPQAFFTLGRAQFLAGRVQDATQSFEHAEMLLTTGLGRPGSLEDLNTTVTPPTKNPSPEWADDLIPWRRYGTSANAMLRYASCGLIPDSLVDFLKPTLLQYVPIWAQQATPSGTLSLGSSLSPQTVNSSNSSNVFALVIRNRCTHSRLRLDKFLISGAEFVIQFPLEGHMKSPVTPFPNLIGPQEAAVVLWRQTGWVTFTSTLGVRYVVEDLSNNDDKRSTHFVECYCEAHKFGKGKAIGRSLTNATSTTFMKTGESSVDSGKNFPRTPNIRTSVEQMKWLVVGAGQVSTFSLCPVMSENNRLNDVELLEVLQMMLSQPSSLRKVASVTIHHRDVIGLLSPPSFFFSQGARPAAEHCYPDYSLGLVDWLAGPWVVPREGADKPVTWKIVALQDFLHSFEIGFLDRGERRVLGTLLNSGAASSLDGVVVSGGPWRNSLLTFAESWSSPSTELLTPTKRAVGKLTMAKGESNVLSVTCDCPQSSMQILAQRQNKQGETTFEFTRHRGGSAVNIATLTPGSNWGFSKGAKFPNRGDVIATITLLPGADGLLVASLVVFLAAKC